MANWRNLKSVYLNIFRKYWLDEKRLFFKTRCLEIIGGEIIFLRGCDKECLMNVEALKNIPTEPVSVMTLRTTLLFDFGNSIIVLNYI